MKIRRITPDGVRELIYKDAERFLEMIESPEAFVVPSFYDPAKIVELRDRIYESGLSSEPAWHPLDDDCPDYHRVHANYPQAHVKSCMHAFYFHGWKAENHDLFEFFREIFEMKAELGGFRPETYLRNRPSDGPVARVLVHNYPQGGGGQAEHVDPVSRFARLQTIVQASTPGEDYKAGGVYGRSGSVMHAVDEGTGPGDLILMSPGIRHGVAEIDPEAEYDWRRNSGRWVFMPIILHSDYHGGEVERPRAV